SLKPKRWSVAVIGSGVIGVSYYVYHKNRAKCDLDVDEVVDIGDTLSLQSLNQSIESENFNLRRIWLYLRSDSMYLLIAITSALIVAILNIEIPLSIGSVMDVLSRFANEENSSFWSNRFFVEMKGPAHRVFQLFVLQSLFTFAYISSLAVVGEKAASRIRSDLFASIIRLDTSFFDIQKSSEIISRLTNDVQEFKSSFKLFVPSMVFCGSFLGSYLRQMSKESQAQSAKASGVAGEAISNVRTVKAFAMEESQSIVYDRELMAAEELNIKLGLGIGVLQGLTNLGLNCIVLGTLVYGGKLLSSDEISAGNLMSFLVATQTIQKSLSQLSLMFGHFIRGTSAITRVFEYIDIKPTVVLNTGVILNKVVGEIEFRNVGFSYPTRSGHKVLKDFNLKLIPAKVTAICGHSGEGKSTIASLLERFYDIDYGSITLDGCDIKTLDPNWLRRHVIGFINQEPILFGTTVMENIRFGKPEATDEEVMSAARLANAHNFITDFPDGYQTIVGERGVTVSGGQKQRIAIARALIKNPNVLILDEATSALDTESEALVQEALEKVMKNRTVLVIAHRLSTIQNADMIAVISKGRLAEIGTHSQLIKEKGLYWNLIRQQFDASDD
ncbi:unnamed protein product, partial [Oppiella nova]